MVTFANVIRVCVTDPSHPLAGKCGTVARRRKGDDGAWVDMDDPLPGELANFPAGDSRHKHVLLYPDQCESIVLTLASRPPNLAPGIVRGGVVSGDGAGGPAGGCPSCEGGD